MTQSRCDCVIDQGEIVVHCSEGRWLWYERESAGYRWARERRSYAQYQDARERYRQHVAAAAEWAALAEEERRRGLAA